MSRDAFVPRKSWLFGLLALCILKLLNFIYLPSPSWELISEFDSDVPSTSPSKTPSTSPTKSPSDVAIQSPSKPPTKFLSVNNITVDMVIPWSGPATTAATYRDIQNDSGLYNVQRDRDNGELMYTLRSIALHMSWINNVYIMVNGVVEKPKYVPASLKQRVFMIDRCTIMPTNTCPTRNPHGMWPYVYKLTNLSQYYLMAEDDICIGRPVEKRHFFNFSLTKNEAIPFVFHTGATWGRFYDKYPHDFHPLYNSYEAIPQDLYKSHRLPLSSCPCLHFYYPMLKSIAVSLEHQYSDLFVFIASHYKGRWDSVTANSNDAINSQEEDYFGIAQWELIRTGFGMKKDIRKNRQWWAEVWPGKATKTEFDKLIHNKDTNPVFLNFNDRFSDDKAQYLAQSTLFHNTLRILFPENT
eukprot:713222_1